MTTAPLLVSPGDIQNALNRIWESLETTSTTRACLFNLIFYTQKNHRSAYIHRIAQKVVEKFPSRVIFLSVDSEVKDPYLHTEVSILKSSAGEFDVACDYIQIDAGGSFRERVPFVVLPHMIPDLPVYLVWAEDPSQEDLLNQALAPFASRLIFDSEDADNLVHFASSVLNQQAKFHCEIADLNWARIESWRDMFMMAFYAPEKLKQIQSSKNITISYNAQETPFFCHTKIQAVYLQAWLACQLGWTFQSVKNEQNHLLFSYKTESGSVAISIDPAQHATLPPGLILSVNILTASEETFSFCRHLELLHQITYQRSTPNQCDLPCHYIFAKAESGHSLVKEICHRGTSQHYLKVLNLIQKMEGLKQC